MAQKGGYKVVTAVVLRRNGGVFSFKISLCIINQAVYFNVITSYSIHYTKLYDISLSNDLIRFLFLRVRRTTHFDLLLRRVFSWRRENRQISLRDEQKHEMRSDEHENGDNDGKVNEFQSEIV